MLQLNAFNHFKNEIKNKPLVDEGLFGVLVLTKQSWVPTKITEQDFARYEHVSYYDSEELRIKLEDAAWKLGNTIAPMWPLVRLIEW